MPFNNILLLNTATKFVHTDGILGIKKIFIAKNIVLIN